LGPRLEAIATLLFYLLLGVVIPVAMVGARRYRMSRTSWRGVRLSFRGRASQFIGIFSGGLFLTFVTAFLYYPVYKTRSRRFLVEHTYFGNVPFRFEGKTQDLYPRFFLAWLFTLPTLGVYWFWFMAERERYYWRQTHFATARFNADFTGGQLLRLALTNALLIVFTLNLARSWVRVRSQRFLFERVRLEGPLDLAAIQQDAQLATATGEGLTAVLDTSILDVDLGV
jgi:uncharacterized membrane protein YjgN (DUF898 family)